MKASDIAIHHLKDKVGLAEADRIMAEVRADALREAADEVHAAFHGYPYLNYPPDFADHLRRMADITQDEWTLTRDAERTEAQTP